MEKRTLSFFLIFTFVGLFLPTKKYFGKEFSELVKLTKFSLFVLICLYLFKALFENSNIILFFFLIYVIQPKAVEAFLGPIIIFCCFNLNLIIEKANVFTIYLKNKYSSYRNLLKNNIFSKFFRIENILTTILLISVCSTFIVNRNIEYNVHFEKEQIETIFYIKDNIPEDSKILVHWYGDTQDALYSLLSTYKIYDWDFSEGENNIIEIKEYIRDKHIEYVLLDLETVSSIELFNFTSDLHFEYLYENEVHIFFKYHESLSIYLLS